MRQKAKITENETFPNSKDSRLALLKHFLCPTLCACCLISMKCFPKKVTIMANMPSTLPLTITL